MLRATNETTEITSEATEEETKETNNQEPKKNKTLEIEPREPLEKNRSKLEKN